MTLRNIVALTTSFSFLIIISFSCDDGSDETENNPSPPTSDCSTVGKTFNDANGIIQARCSTNGSCHGNGSSRGPGALVTYEQIFAARNDIRSSVISGSMPKNSSLTAAQKATIICWIDNGALPN